MAHSWGTPHCASLHLVLATVRCRTQETAGKDRAVLVGIVFGRAHHRQANPTSVTAEFLHRHLAVLLPVSVVTNISLGDNHSAEYLAHPSTCTERKVAVTLVCMHVYSLIVLKISVPISILCVHVFQQGMVVRMRPCQAMRKSHTGYMYRTIMISANACRPRNTCMSACI